MLIDGRESERLMGGGMPLGLFAESEYEIHERDLQNGDLLVVYTDGVTEALNPGEEEFGESRLAKVVASHSGGTAADIASAVLDGLRSHGGIGASQHDDITLLVLRPRERGS